MKLNNIEKLIASFPEGKKKQALLEKVNQLRKRNNDNGKGLHDEFAMKPTGHIQIEEIDANGEVVGVLADQPNLVVDGSEEILLRSFSGDPDRILYKNRKLKGNSSKIYHIDLKEIMAAEDGSNIVVNHPNKLWEAVDDNEFDIEYSYYPNTLYVKEENSVEPNQKAFTLHSTSSASTAPLTAEVYSTFTNLFIGLGDGVNYDVPLNDSRLTYTGSFTGDNVKETSQINDEVAFEEKISNFVLLYNTSNKGGQIGVYIDDVLIDTVETLDSSLPDDEVKVQSAFYNSLNQEKASKVKLKFTGSDDSVPEPIISIVGIKFDAFSKEMNGLIHEFENHTNSFLTPTVYNTTSVSPYTIKLDHAPVKENSMKVMYNNVELTEAKTKEEVTEGTFYVDHLYGVAYFNRALTGLMVSFETTGQIMQDEKVSNLTTKDVLINVTNETPDGVIDGANKNFTLKHKNITSLTVKLDEEKLQEGSGSSQYRINKSTGVLTLGTAPPESSNLVVDYTFKKNVNVLKTDLSIAIDKDMMMHDQNLNTMTKGVDVNALVDSGVFVLDTSDKENHTILITKETSNSEQLKDLTLFYYSDEKPGVPTNYKRQIVLKPKDVNEYPWYALDKGSVQFVAEFQEDVPNSSVTIREMGLFDGPRVDDQIKGFTGYPVKAFSLVRVGEARKDVATGLRVTWTITLTNEDGDPFQGGK